MSTGEGLVPEQADEAQADAARGGGEGSAAGGRGEQELSPRQQVEARDGASAAAGRSAAAATTAAVPALHAEAQHARLGRRLLLGLRDLRLDKFLNRSFLI